MRDGLSTLLAALDSAPAPVRFFIRDDDAGWHDERLLALLDVVDAATVPIDLALIPMAVASPLAAELRGRHDAAPQRLGLHQHGFAHTNHESEGRKCEFGPARGTDAQRQDLQRGRQRLGSLFGSRLDPIFTPPWNRCGETTPALLHHAGYAALSRDRGAPAQAWLAEIAVDLDWCKQRRLATANGAGERIGSELARLIAAGRNPLGVMLHHAGMDADDLVLLRQWLPAWAGHPRARFVAMRALMRRSR